VDRPNRGAQGEEERNLQDTTVKEKENQHLPCRVVVVVWVLALLWLPGATII